MKIRELFPGGSPTLSFEVFPPKRKGNVEKLYQTIEELTVFEPDFISVTYGAGGSTRDKTVDIASKIKNEFRRETLAHLTCVQSTMSTIDAVLDELDASGIENILALRGDPPNGEESFIKPPGGFGYANELVEHIAERYSFCIGVAGYPAVHLEAPDRETDLVNLKRKVDAGADFIITQLFFTNDLFYRFRDDALSHGITVPIIPGIFPIFNYAQVEKIAALCGREPDMPLAFFDKIRRVADRSDECEKYGIEYSTRQAEGLLANDVAGLHFYCMNRSTHIMKILNHLSYPASRQKPVE